MQSLDILLLLAVLLPPRALDIIGPVTEERVVETAYGSVGPLAKRQAAGGPAVWIAPYSGSPTRTDPRATVMAARELRVARVLNWDRGIAINPLLRRGHTLIAADYIDWTRGHPFTFQEGGQSSRNPDEVALRPAFCPQMRAGLQSTLPSAFQGVYLGIDGPRRETAAEARMFRQWGVDVLGQNVAPEVALAQELGLCYAGLITVVGYSADQAAPVFDGEVRHNLETITGALPTFIEQVAVPRTCDCGASF